MYTTRRTNQGGSVAIFLVVSIVLSALVIGGAYAVQKRGADVRTNEPIVQQTDTTPEAAPQDTDANKQNTDDEAKKQAEAQKKAEADKAAQAAAEKQRQADQQAAVQPTIPQTSTAPTAETLPTTGPEDSFPQIVGGALLLAIIIAYLKSYRHRFGSLRQ